MCRIPPGQGVHFVDIGTPGSIWGLENGYSIMVGGSDAAVSTIRLALASLSHHVGVERDARRFFVGIPLKRLNR